MQDCAEWMLQPLFHASFKTGGFHLSNKVDPVPANQLDITPEAQEALYAHFIEETGKY